MNLKKEKSCGCIIVDDDKVLLIQQNKGHWGFPKGHVENDETEIETAIREVREETNIDVEVEKEKRYSMSYYMDNGILKEVVLFLAHPKNKNFIPQQEEIQDIKWLSINDALNLITFDNSKEALKKILNIGIIK